MCFCKSQAGIRVVDVVVVLGVVVVVVPNVVALVITLVGRIDVVVVFDPLALLLPFVLAVDVVGVFYCCCCVGSCYFLALALSLGMLLLICACVLLMWSAVLFVSVFDSLFRLQRVQRALLVIYWGFCGIARNLEQITRKPGKPSEPTTPKELTKEHAVQFK